MYGIGGIDYDATASQLAFSASESRACMEIPITDDIISEPMEHFAVSLTFPGLLPEGTAVMPDSANITIVDNDGKCTKEVILNLMRYDPYPCHFSRWLDVSVMFARESYTFNEDDVIGVVEVVLSGPVREDALVIVTGGEITS